MRYTVAICVVCLWAPLYGMSLEKVVAAALEKSASVNLAKAQQESMRQKRREKHAAQWGSIDAVGSVTRYNLPRTLVPLTPSVMKDPLAAANVATTETVYSLGVRYSVPLFTGFATTQDIRIADIAARMAEANLRLSKEELVYNVSSMYVGVLSLEETLHAQERYLQALRRLRRTIKKSVELGKKAPLDLLKIDANIAQAEASAAQTRSQSQALKAALEATANVKIDRFEPVKVNVNNMPVSKAKKVDLASLLKHKAAALRTQKAKHALQKSKAAYYPNVALHAYYGYNAGENDASNPQAGAWADETLWQVGVNISWKVADFGVRDARVQQAKIAVLQAHIDEAQTSRRLRQTITQATAKLEADAKAYRAAAKQLKAARKSERIEAVRYDNGAASINDLLYAKAATLMAEAAYIRYRYEWKKAEYFLNYLLERGVKP